MQNGSKNIHVLPTGPYKLPTSPYKGLRKLANYVTLVQALQAWSGENEKADVVLSMALFSLVSTSVFGLFAGQVIYLDFANCDHLAAAEAIVRGASRRRCEKPGYNRPTSGAKIIAWEMEAYPPDMGPLHTATIQ